MYESPWLRPPIGSRSVSPDAPAIVTRLQSLGDPRGDLLALELEAVAAPTVEAARALMRRHAKARAGLALRPWSIPDSESAFGYAWTASGVLAALCPSRPEHVAALNSAAAVGLGALELTARFPRARALLTELERWPQLERVALEIDADALAELPVDVRARLTHLVRTPTDRCAPLPALPRLQAFVAYTYAAGGALRSVDGAPGSSLSERAPQLRALACALDEPDARWLSGLRQLHDLDMRTRAKDVEVLTQLPQLARLRVSNFGRPGDGVLPFARMSRLRELALRGSSHVEIRDVSAAERLQALSIERSVGRPRLEFLGELSQLRALTIRSSPKGFGPVLRLAQLRRLEVDVPWARLRALPPMRALEHLALRALSRPVTQRALDRLELERLELRHLELRWSGSPLDLSRLQSLRSLSLQCIGETRFPVLLPPNIEHLGLAVVMDPARFTNLHALERLRCLEVQTYRLSDVHRFASALPEVRVYTTLADRVDPLTLLRCHERGRAGRDEPERDVSGIRGDRVVDGQVC